jgi:hypothetical protein
VLAILFLCGTAVGAGPAKQLPPPIDPDTLAKQSNDANWSLRWLGNGKYELLIQSTSGLGYIDSFDWVPGLGMHITALTKTVGGNCTLHGGSISCTGKIAPPKCTCLPGGSLTVDFTATMKHPADPKGAAKVSYGLMGSYLAVKSITPVPYHIPSSLPPSNV